MSNKSNFANRLEAAQAKAGRISEAGEQVMSFQDFSAHHSQGRLSFAAKDGAVSTFSIGAILGGASIVNYKGFGSIIKNSVLATIGFWGAYIIFAPSKPERDLQGYEKYLNEKATKVFEKPTQVEMLQMGVGGLGRSV